MGKTIQISIDIDEAELQNRVRVHHKDAVERCLQQLLGQKTTFSGGQTFTRAGPAAAMVQKMVEDAITDYLIKADGEIQKKIAKAFDEALEKAIAKAASHQANKLVFNSPAVRERTEG